MEKELDGHILNCGKWNTIRSTREVSLLLCINQLKFHATKR